ncbi:MAG: hypothetical protein UY35_C0016G0018 [Candidatus Saccharibacteria bacterium GW2011_GWC2_48_9]|nr:MAG: hypothetical protein UY35_C0016G0018 [Candidatus Saccharibacteria bacterium GW2011_GWC2_48_9]
MTHPQAYNLNIQIVSCMMEQICLSEHTNHTHVTAHVHTDSVLVYRPKQVVL